jgi:probable FeS assembly SUF system protein SufT
MMELNDLYRDVILDHNRRPRNFGVLEPADARVEGFNPLCGDRLTVQLKMAGDAIADIRFEGQGCAISTASASLMTEAVKGKSRTDALALFDRIHSLLTDDDAPSDELGKLAALSGSFTVYIDGNLFRIAGHEADAIGKTAANAPEVPPGASEEDVKGIIWQQLKTCYDPEIPVNIVDLGLVYECEVTRNDDATRNVDIKMTLTAPGCGMGEILVQDVRGKVEIIPTVARANVELVFDPPWNQAMMSDEARLQTGMM